MALTQLPTELLNQIVLHTLPEGFEGLALSCKRLHALCIPSFEHYNNLHWHFRDFTYCKTDKSFKFKEHLLRFPDTATSAFNLISRIAIEPVVGRYIQEADFGRDSWLNTRLNLDPSWPTNREETTYEDRDEAVRRLLAHSSYLREAGLDWKEYYSAIEEDLKAARYSQHAAVFALTLLPNLKRFSLPLRWSPTTATEKLLDTVIHRAKQAPPKSMPSLAQVTAVKEEKRHSRFELDWVTPFIALPRIQSFRGPRCIGEGSNDESLGSRYLHSGFNSTVEVLDFWNASIEEVVIAKFLKHTPCLKSLRYGHSTKDSEGCQDWDLC